MKHLVLIAMASLICSAATAQTSTPDAKAPPEKRTCKRVVETGSFVKGKKVCMTAKERNLMAAKSQELGRGMQTLISTEQGR